MSSFYFYKLEQIWLAGCRDKMDITPKRYVPNIPVVVLGGTVSFSEALDGLLEVV